MCGVWYSVSCALHLLLILGELFFSVTLHQTKALLQNQELPALLTSNIAYLPLGSKGLELQGSSGSIALFPGGPLSCFKIPAWKFLHS